MEIDFSEFIDAIDNAQDVMTKPCLIIKKTDKAVLCSFDRDNAFENIWIPKKFVIGYKKMVFFYTNSNFMDCKH